MPDDPKPVEPESESAPCVSYEERLKWAKELFRQAEEQQEQLLREMSAALGKMLDRTGDSDSTVSSAEDDQ